MALPIKETPILKGKQAKIFMKKIKENETKPLTEKEIQDYKRAKKTYDDFMTRNPGFKIEV
jgi:hypothetical protein